VDVDLDVGVEGFEAVLRVFRCKGKGMFFCVICILQR